MFELSVALKYLTPRWRQLSVSIISLISILVISLVVWLIVVFFSVTRGLEKTWTDKLIALTAPIRVTPTDFYYSSYYYKVDNLSANSDYMHKSIGEKLLAEATDPYDPEVDEELPFNWPAPDLNAEGNIKDLVKAAYKAIETVPNLKAQDYEITAANMKLKLLRPFHDHYRGRYNQSVLSQSSYLGTFDPDASTLEKTLLPLTAKDIENLIHMAAIEKETLTDEGSDAIQRKEQTEAAESFRRLFSKVRVAGVQIPPEGVLIPSAMLPEDCPFEACLVTGRNGKIEMFMPEDKGQVKNFAERLEKTDSVASAKPSTIIREQGRLLLLEEGVKIPLPAAIPLMIVGGSRLEASVVAESIETAIRPEDLLAEVKIKLQGNVVEGQVPLTRFDIAEVSLTGKEDGRPLFWLSKENGQYNLPSSDEYGEGILLPRSFREGGLLVGDRGYISYYSPTVASVQEQRVPVVIAGFYDPGILPVGGKFILANRELTNLIRSNHNEDGAIVSNGINIRLDDIDGIDQIKAKLQEQFDKAGITPYWKIQTFKEFEYTKDIVQQLQSERNLFTLLATIIMVVACSNIISMLIILVNDKKMEIGILRTMGATSKSISLIFGFCGVTLGLLGSVIGIVLAGYTLSNLQSLINFISKVQGFEMFNPAFYGETLPSQLNVETLTFVIVMTVIVSGVAGIVPAIKACLLKPSTILKAE